MTDALADETAGTGSTVANASVVDLFCGAGGLTHGFLKQGFEVVAGIDLDETCAYPYEANNYPAVFLHADIDDVTVQDLGHLYGPGDTRILVGCAPCQPFSRYTNKKRGDHAKWKLLHSFSSLVRSFRPDVLSMENVPDLVKHSVFNDFLAALEDGGYYVWHGLVDCVDHGVPQTRERLVLLASVLGEIELIQPADARRLTVQEVIGHLEPIEAGCESATDPLHRSSGLTPINLRRIRASRPGGSWQEWPDELKLECHKKPSGESFGSVYGRMVWTDPAPTMTTQCNGIGNGRFGHPEQDRAISMREAALFQTFPENYDFIDPSVGFNFSHLARQIGNAVPVRLAESIAASIRAHLETHRGNPSTAN